MQIKALQNNDELNRFIEFPQTVYRDVPTWVPPDSHHMLSQLAGGIPGASPVAVQAFMAFDSGGAPEATVAAVVHDAFNRHWGESLGHLVFFEALPDREAAAAALLREACEWLRGRGCDAARLAFLPGWQLPLTIDAYDHAPTFLHATNPPFYHRYIKDAGFVTEQGLVEYRVVFTPDVEREYRRMADEAARGGAHLRSWDFSRLEEETAAFCRLTNACFARHWGMPTFTVEELSGLTLGLKDFLNPDFTVFAEVDGQTAGYVYALPDLNRAFHAFRGRNPADHADEFQLHLRAIEHGMLLVIGVTEGHRGRGINLAMAARSYLAMIERGYKSASYTVVLDDNWPSRRTAEKLGGRVWRNYVVYRKKLV